MQYAARIGIPSALIALAGLLYHYWPSARLSAPSDARVVQGDPSQNTRGELAAEAPSTWMPAQTAASRAQPRRVADRLPMTSEPPPPLPPLMPHQPTPPASVSPPSLTIAHAELLAHAADFSNVAEAAARFGQHQREPADPGFAPMTEVGLIEYLVRHLPPGEFSVQSVSCRTQGCFIQVFGYRENPATRWQATLSGLEGAPMTEALAGHQTISGQWPGGQSALLTFLPRRNG